MGNEINKKGSVERANLNLNYVMLAIKLLLRLIEKLILNKVNIINKLNERYK